MPEDESRIAELEALRERLLECQSVDPNSEAMLFVLTTIDDVMEYTSSDTDNLNLALSPSEDSSMSKRKSKSTKDEGASRATRKKRHVGPINIIFAMIRFVLVELPLVSLCALGLSTALLSHVYDEYLDPQFDLMHYSDENRADDLTYYHRECSPEDITTRVAEDLYIQDDYTIDDNVDHMLFHGMSMYKSILQDETADELRTWILERNKSLKEKDEIGVISNENRWSFFIGANDKPVVSKALNEIATHPVFRPALEKIVGKNPAIIEMTAITSAYGAADQFWHADVLAGGSLGKYARSFTPSYAVFIALQVSCLHCCILINTKDASPDISYVSPLTRYTGY